MQFKTVTPHQVRETMRLNNMSEKEVVEEYLSYPPIPYKTTIKIDKIALLNFNVLTRETMGALKYKTFRQQKPEDFPVCQNPKLDYEDEEDVSPAIIVSGDVKYRAPQNLWFPLSDAAADLMRRQGQLGRKLLPIEVYIDEKDQWMVPLFNLSRGP